MKHLLKMKLILVVEASIIHVQAFLAVDILLRDIAEFLETLDKIIALLDSDFR